MAGWSIYLLLLAAAFTLRLLHLWLTPKILRSAGVPDADVAKWTLSEAGSRRVVELIRALRGKEPDPAKPPET